MLSVVELFGSFVLGVCGQVPGRQQQATTECVCVVRGVLLWMVRRFLGSKPVKLWEFLQVMHWVGVVHAQLYSGHLLCCKRKCISENKE